MKIKINYMKHELRVGNWVSSEKKGWDNINSKFLQVKTIGRDGINEWQDMGVSGCYEFDVLEPIPITSEILEKAGFVKKTNREWAIGENPVNQDYMMIVRYSPIINGFYFLNGHFKINDLHQLQNLYFALTGEELPIDFPSTSPASA